MRALFLIVVFALTASAGAYAYSNIKHSVAAHNAQIEKILDEAQ